MATKVSTGKKSIMSATDRAKKFGDLAGRIDYAAIGQQNPQVQMMILQQKEQEAVKAYQETDTKTAQLQQKLDQLGDQENLSPEAKKEADEIKTELENNIKLGQKYKHEIKNVQEMKMEAQNAAAQEYSFRNRTKPSPISR